MPRASDVPVQGGASLDSALQRLAGALIDRIPRSVEAGLLAMKREEREYFVLADEDPGFVEVYHRSYADHLRMVWTGLAQGGELPAGEPAAFAVGEAVGAARLGISLEALLHTFRIGHRLMLEEAFEAAEDIVADPKIRRSA